MLTFTQLEGGVCIDPDEHGLTRRLRWASRSRARQIAYLHDQKQPSESEEPTQKTQNLRTRKAPDVILRLHNGRAHASGLMACGTFGPARPAQHAYERAELTEIETALYEHCASGGTIGMMTLTMRHDSSMRLAASLDRLNDTWRTLQQRRAFKPLRMATTGTIATLEITYRRERMAPTPPHHPASRLRHHQRRRYRKGHRRATRPSGPRLVNEKHDRHSIAHGLDLTWFGRNSKSSRQPTSRRSRKK